MGQPLVRTGYQIGGDLYYEYNRAIRMSGKGLRNLTQKLLGDDVPAGIDDSYDSVIGSHRGYSDLRGLFVPKSSRAVTGQDFDRSRIFYFQFNPTEINVVKESLRVYRNYNGLNFGENIWVGGGEKQISFTLYLDATAGSQYKYFRANSIDDVTILKALETQKARGTAPEVELLESFMQPEVPDDNGEVRVPEFTKGDIVMQKQFYPPPLLIWSFGEFYLEGILSSLNITHTLFSPDLRPLRTEAQVTFTVFEQVPVKILPELSALRK